MAWLLGACKRCAGDLEKQTDREYQCLQCGAMFTLKPPTALTYDARGHLKAGARRSYGKEEA